MASGTYFGMTKEQKEKMMQALLRQQQQQMNTPQQQNVIGGAGTDVQPMQGQISPAQQAAISKMQNAPMQGMAAIQAVKTPGLGGALAKTLTAGLTRHYGDKRRGKEVSALRKASQAEADKLAREEQRDIERQETLDLLAGRRVATGEMNAETALLNANKEPTMTPYQRESLDVRERELAHKKAKELVEETETKPLTSTGLQTGLRNLNDRLSPLNDLMARVEHIDNLLRPFSSEGKQGDKGNIPGVGFIEGSRGAFGDITRAVWSGEEGQQIQSALSELTSEQMREKIGSAQTSIEIQNTLRALGQQDFSNEETAIAALERFKEILYDDVSLLRDSTHKEVLEDFDSRFGEGRQNPFDRKREGMQYKHLQRYDQGEEVGLPPVVMPEGIDPNVWGRLTDEQKRRFLEGRS